MRNSQSRGVKQLKLLGKRYVLKGILIFKNFKKKAIVKHLNGLGLDKYPA